MVIYAISKDKSYYRIGNSPDTKDWYAKTPEVAKILDTINKGDEVSIKYEKNESGKRLLTSIEVTKKTTKPLSIISENKWRKPEELRRDETLRSACLAIQAMPAQFADVSALSGAVCLLYDKLLEKVR